MGVIQKKRKEKNGRVKQLGQSQKRKKKKKGLDTCIPESNESTHEHGEGPVGFFVEKVEGVLGLGLRCG